MVARGATAEERALGYMMMISEDYRKNPEAPDLPTYISHWLSASADEVDREALALLQSEFPPCPKPMIATGETKWNSRDGARRGDPSRLYSQ